MRKHEELRRKREEAIKQKRRERIAYLEAAVKRKNEKMDELRKELSGAIDKINGFKDNGESITQHVLYTLKKAEYWQSVLVSEHQDLCEQLAELDVSETLAHNARLLGAIASTVASRRSTGWRPAEATARGRPLLPG